MVDDSITSTKSTDSYKGSSVREVKPKSAHEVLTPIPDELRCGLSWQDLAYFCPLTPERQDLIKTGMSEGEIRS